MVENTTWTFSDIDEASRAKQALLGANFSEDQLRLNVLGDEAGPVEGNFVLDYKDASVSDDNSVLDKVLTANDLNEGQKRQPVQWRAICALTISHESKLDDQSIRSIMASFQTQEQQ